MTLTDATCDFLSSLENALPPKALRPVTPAYVEEPRGTWQGQAAAVVAPQTAQQVAQVLRLANAARVGVVPYGGGTGLVGGQVMPDGPKPILLSLERMTAVRALYPLENLMIAEAGAILQDLHGAARGVDRLFPLSFGAKGSARIGGSLSTNAGGVNVLRYGNTRELCLGLEAVLPDGRILNNLSRLRKDNTGYDLRDLFIGAEGTLGVITAATLRLSPRPAAEGTALMVVSSPSDALDLLALARDHLAEGISAFELINRTGLDFLAEHLADVRQPFDTPPEWFVLIDVGLMRGIDPAEALETLFADAFERGLVQDGLIAQSEAQRAAFWEVRERIPEANRMVGSICSHDISVPLGLIPDFITRAGAALEKMGDYRINCFGHLGDGNLHYNVFPAKGRSRAEYAAQKAAISGVVHELVHALEGSFSAEHGVGRLKTADLERYADPVKLQLMRGLKDLFDPNGIMNPGAVLRARS
ncbi:FAD-binding oxidoreductase [Thalassobius sp. S69A]|uniref:FAD-binding oxidoreductase n=1 Tax=unclassified Thalassovita TaxID=2619711 RepID=UPI000C0E2F37|nr:hydroxyacid dehydrogenase [Paracoccaceae bacterium]MBT26475.1 hydroxyacid dehydrogenase [Paracoccaceae bacterium]